MKTNIRQGIVYKPVLPKMLYNIDNKINIRLNEDKLILTFAHGQRDYSVILTENIDAAWVVDSISTNCWLYWEIDQGTGSLIYGVTYNEPLNYGRTLPASPVKGDHFFDRNDNKMKFFNGSKWVDKIRLFAAEIKNGVINEYGVYSQVNLRGDNNVGKILYDDNNKPIFDYVGKHKYFATSADSITTLNDLYNIGLDKLHLNVVAGESIPKYTSVILGEDNMVYAGSCNNDIPVLGLAAKTYAPGDQVHIISSGVIEDSIAWAWVQPTNTKLFVGENGELTTELINEISSQIIGKIISPKAILINIQEKINIIQDVVPKPTVTPTVTPTPTPTAQTTPTVTPTVTISVSVTPAPAPSSTP